MLLFLKKKNSIITTLKGYKAPINAPKPLEINFKLQVLTALAKTKVRMAKKNNFLNCCKVGIDSFLNKKKIIKIFPAIN